MAAHRSPILLPNSKPNRVALLIETSLASGREILLGVARYVRENRPWLLYHEPRGLEDDLPRWLSGWKGDGIIARVQTQEMVDELSATKLPVVDTLGVVGSTEFPLIHSDNFAIGIMAADYLIDLGIRRFAYLGIEGEGWSEDRETSFVEHVRKKGFDAVVRRERRGDIDRLSWDVYQSNLAAWVQNLPCHIGVMVCSDQRASPFLDACRRAGRSVPDDIAVIGVDNDEPLCGVCNPPLTSVWPNHELIGYQAAALLQQIMDGNQHPEMHQVLLPKCVVDRTSTDTLAVEDRVVSEALKIIRKQSFQRLSIDEIAEAVDVSRSVLQRRFRAVIGQTVNDAIVTRRLESAQKLLLDTKLTLLEVAKRCGFQHQEYMGAVFKARLGVTPSVFRRNGQK